MKKGFFEELKQYLINYERENLHTLIPYYETLLQHKNDLKFLLEEYDKYEFDFQYIEKNVPNYYNNGSILIYLYERNSENENRLNYIYEIELLTDERYWGICDCLPEDEGYNEKHNCCGNGCDYIFPAINITKISNILCKSFNGVARDLWKLEEKWETYLKEHEEKQRQNEIERIDKSIKELQKRKSKLLN